MTRVLVIEDNDDLRKMIRYALTKAGYEVIEAENGVRGLEAFRQLSPELVLLDMYMPEKDGLETLRDLRRLEPKVRVIAMTGGGTRSDMGILKPAVLMGATQVLFKPFSPIELQATVAATLAEPES